MLSAVAGQAARYATAAADDATGADGQVAQDESAEAGQAAQDESAEAGHCAQDPDMRPDFSDLLAVYGQVKEEYRVSNTKVLKFSKATFAHNKNMLNKYSKQVQHNEHDIFYTKNRPILV